MKNLSWIYFLFLLIYFMKDLNGEMYFQFDVNNVHRNRRVFVRNYHQTYFCPDANGWVILSPVRHPNLELFNRRTSLLIKHDSNVGIYMVECGGKSLELIILDKSQFTMIVNPKIPKSLRIGEAYVFQIHLQPNVVSEDRTYTWKPIQVSGPDEITLITERNLLILQTNTSRKTGEYSIRITADYNLMKTFKFNMTAFQPEPRIELSLPDNTKEMRGIISGFRKFYFAFIGFGVLTCIIGMFIYFCSFLGKRNTSTEINTYKEVLEEEKELMEDPFLKTYKLMNNPMNREKDLDLLYAMFKNLLEKTGKKFETSESYKLDTQEIYNLKSRFPKGVCLNCVKFASQLILLQKTDCSFINHTCEVPPGKSFDKLIQCKCLEDQADDLRNIVQNNYINPTCCLNNSNSVDVNRQQINMDHNKQNEEKKDFVSKTYRFLKSIGFAGNREKSETENHHMSYIKKYEFVANKQEPPRIFVSTPIATPVNTKMQNVSVLFENNQEKNPAGQPHPRAYQDSNTDPVYIELMPDNILNRRTTTVQSSMRTANQCQNVDWCFLNDKLLQCPNCMHDAVKRIINAKFFDDLKISKEVKDMVAKYKRTMNDSRGKYIQNNIHKTKNITEAEKIERANFFRQLWFKSTNSSSKSQGELVQKEMNEQKISEYTVLSNDKCEEESKKIRHKTSQDLSNSTGFSIKDNSRKGTKRIFKNKGTLTLATGEGLQKKHDKKNKCHHDHLHRASNFDLETMINCKKHGPQTSVCPFH